MLSTRFAGLSLTSLTSCSVVASLDRITDYVGSFFSHPSECARMSRASGQFSSSFASSSSSDFSSPPGRRTLPPGPTLEMPKKRGIPLGSTPIPGVETIIAIASGKGGVGKSTTAVNIATALANRRGLKVGLMDVDVFGPSIPTMMNLTSGVRPEVNQYNQLIPLENHGVKCMSMGFLMDEGSAAVWRGPMVMSALEKLMFGTAWGKLDVLVLDMPPGTGDAQLSVGQRLNLTGAVIVSTPQDIALIDARRGATMFQKIHVPILGLIENMSYHKCTNCGHVEHLFGEGGVKKTAEAMGLRLLGEVPLQLSVREMADEGTPVVIADPDSVSAAAYAGIAGRIADLLEERAKERRGKKEAEAEQKGP